MTRTTWTKWALGDEEGYPSAQGLTYPRVGYGSRAVTPPNAQGHKPYKVIRELFGDQPGANGYLLNTSRGIAIPLWISDITVDFELAGNTAQSVFKRDFYPHNFVQPIFALKGQTFNQAQAGYMAEFIREGQLDCVSERGGGDYNSRGLLRVIVPGAGYIPYRTKIQDKPKPIYRRFNRSQRGWRDHLDIVGYIQQAKRSHQRFEVATEWGWNFVVARMLAGPFTEDAIQSQLLKDVPDWADILRGQQANKTFITDPDDKNAKLPRKPPARDPEGDYDGGFDSLPGPLNPDASDWINSQG